MHRDHSAWAGEACVEADRVPALNCVHFWSSDGRVAVDVDVDVNALEPWRDQ